MNDTCRIFDLMVSRKPCTWAECAIHRLSELHLKRINTLPIVETLTGPMEHFLGENPPRECVVVHQGHHHYVNSEGYSYARYAFRIANP